MPMDMYCTFEGLPGESEPVHLVILAWSHGLVKNPQKETSEPHPSTWDVKAVGEWLKRSNLEEFVKVFEEQDISGKELFSVTREDLNDMKITKVGHKIRLENAIDDLRAKFPDPPAEQKNRRGQNVQDLSMTCYMDDRCYKLLFHLLQGSVIPKATLFCYQSSRPGYGRHRGGGSDDEDDSDLVAPKARDLLSAIILKNAQVTSLSTGGSGGEDRFTANLTLTSHQMSFIGQMYPSVEAKTYAKYNTQPHGVVVEYEAGKAKAYIKEWGVQAGWSKHSHISFPQEFKNTVWTLLLIHNTKKNALFGQLPAECLHNIFLQLSHHYMPTNPFEGVEYPGHISTKKSKDED